MFLRARKRCPSGIDFLGYFLWEKCRGNNREFRPLLDDSQRAALEPGAKFPEKHCADHHCCKRRVWLVRRLWSAQVGSLFSADAWNNIGFTAAEVKNPKRDVATLHGIRTIIRDHSVLPRESAYLCTLPLVQIQSAPDDSRGQRGLNAIFGPRGDDHGGGDHHFYLCCNNGLILAGARVSYAMARDGSSSVDGQLNKRGVPGTRARVSGIWIAVLILLRTRHVDAVGMVTYGISTATCSTTWFFPS